MPGHTAVLPVPVERKLKPETAAEHPALRRLSRHIRYATHGTAMCVAKAKATLSPRGLPVALAVDKQNLFPPPARRLRFGRGGVKIAWHG